MKNNNGQAILMVVFAVVISTSIALVIFINSLSDLKTTTSQQESERAFNAAEAGIEEILANGNIYAGGESEKITIGDLEADITIANNDNKLLFEVKQNDLITINLSGPENGTCWSTDKMTCDGTCTSPKFETPSKTPYLTCIEDQKCSGGFWSTDKGLTENENCTTTTVNEYSPENSNPVYAKCTATDCTPPGCWTVDRNTCDAGCSYSRIAERNDLAFSSCNKASVCGWDCGTGCAKTYPSYITFYGAVNCSTAVGYQTNNGGSQVCANTDPACYCFKGNEAGTVTYLSYRTLGQSCTNSSGVKTLFTDLPIACTSPSGYKYAPANPTTVYNFFDSPCFLDSSTSCYKRPASKTSYPVTSLEALPCSATPNCATASYYGSYTPCIWKPGTPKNSYTPADPVTKYTGSGTCVDGVEPCFALSSPQPYYTGGAACGGTGCTTGNYSDSVSPCSWVKVVNAKRGYEEVNASLPTGDSCAGSATCYSFKELGTPRPLYKGDSVCQNECELIDKEYYIGLPIACEPITHVYNFDKVTIKWDSETKAEDHTNLVIEKWYKDGDYNVGVEYQYVRDENQYNKTVDDPEYDNQIVINIAPVSEKTYYQIKIRPIFANTTILAEAPVGSSFPPQQQEFTSVSQTQTGESRAIKVTKTFPQVPGIFDYVLFSNGGDGNLSK